MTKHEKIKVCWYEIEIAVKKKQISRIYGLLRELRDIYQGTWDSDEQEEESDDEIDINNGKTTI